VDDSVGNEKLRLKKYLVYAIVFVLLIIAILFTPKQLLLSPPGFSDDYTVNIGSNSNIYNYAKIAWDGSTNYYRSGAGTGSMDGVFTSKAISMGQSSPYLKASWASTNDVIVKVSTNNGASWCTVQNGQYIVSGSGCTLPASSFKYQVKLPDNNLPSKIDKIWFDWTPPQVCGNSIIESNEQCDGTNLNGQTCVSLGFASGNLGCFVSGQANECRFDLSSCIPPVCGNGIKETGETCDDTNTNNGDGCSSICRVENGWKCSGQPSKCIASRITSSVNDNKIAKQCSDGVDNDGDGAADMADFSCSDPSDTDEANPNAQCQNGVDDDGNGFVDYPQDTGCDSKQDNFEFGGAIGSICSNGLIEEGETCDDSNLNDRDGCSSNCFVEAGWTCSGEPSTCSQQAGNKCPEQWLACDSAGWTILNPSTDSRIIYVSSAGSSNPRPYSKAEVGSDPTHPAITVQAYSNVADALAQIRDGYPDWVLFKKGDTFVVNGLYGANGRSASEPEVIGSYGTGNRPLIKTGSNNGFDTRALDIHDRAIVGLHFWADSWDGHDSGPGGIYYVTNTGNRILFEDNMIENYGAGISISPQVSFFDISFRRNVIIDGNRAYTDNNGAAGIFTSNTQGLILVDGNVMDIRTSLVNAGHRQSEYVYSTQDNGQHGSEANIIVRNNWFRNSGRGAVQCRSGCDAYNNVFIRNDLGITLGSDDNLDVSTGHVFNNTFVYSRNYNVGNQPKGIGVWPVHSLNVEIDHNLIVHSSDGTGNAAFTIPWNAANTNIHDNVVYNWTKTSAEIEPATVLNGPIALNSVILKNNELQPGGQAYIAWWGTSSHPLITVSGNKYWTEISSWPFFLGGVGGLSFSQWVSATGDNSVFEKIQYSHPERNPESYAQSLGLGYNIENLMTSVRSLSKENWDTRFTTDGFNGYIRQGFVH